MDFGIVYKPAFTLVGIPVRANWDTLWSEMPKAWQQWFARMSEVKSRAGRASIDASLAVKDGEYFQLVGAPVLATDDIPDDMLCVEIPQKQYVYAEHTGPLHNIADSFDAMMQWAEAQGHALSDFKLDMGYLPKGKEHSHQLYIEIIDISL